MQTLKIKDSTEARARNEIAELHQQNLKTIKEGRFSVRLEMMQAEKASTQPQPIKIEEEDADVDVQDHGFDETTLGNADQEPEAWNNLADDDVVVLAVDEDEDAGGTGEDRKAFIKQFVQKV
ncbi:hypothetical protein N0V83_001901 [Neocucurbitaria cava]|uniref:Uncharacterized protein n=1 Tax=Neocucurbitaria cava TaxID=798079 RepID=A0A9W8YDR8_9PLEO|nr:hypothetical protein N0V83_001901 [Neocucurbitaria cava]